MKSAVRRLAGGRGQTGLFCYGAFPIYRSGESLPQFNCDSTMTAPVVLDEHELALFWRVDG
jgi:hypothetical protein